LFFQVSDQEPYYGQVTWFQNWHPEKVPSAIERCVNKIGRVSGVLDRWLDGKEYLVGEKCSYANLAFVPWQVWVPRFVGDAFDPAKEFPNVQAWLDRLTSRPGAEAIIRERGEGIASQGRKT